MQEWVRSNLSAGAGAPFPERRIEHGRLDDQPAEQEEPEEQHGGASERAAVPCLAIAHGR